MNYLLQSGFEIEQNIMHDQRRGNKIIFGGILIEELKKWLLPGENTKVFDADFIASCKVFML